MRTTIPGWLVKVLITTLVGGLFTGAAAWSRSLSSTTRVHETRISVLDTQLHNLHEDIGEIKQSQIEMNQKLDRLIERRK